MKRVFSYCALVVLSIAALFWIFSQVIAVVTNLYTANLRAKQKVTMGTMRKAAERHEKGQSIGSLRDGWDRPIRVHVDGRHYSLRSAGSDGVFERGVLAGPVLGYTRDIVLINGYFWQMPEGI